MNHFSLYNVFESWFFIRIKFNRRVSIPISLFISTFNPFTNKSYFRKPLANISCSCFRAFAIHEESAQRIPSWIHEGSFFSLISATDALDRVADWNGVFIGFICFCTFSVSLTRLFGSWEWERTFSITSWVRFSMLGMAMDVFGTARFSCFTVWIIFLFKIRDWCRFPWICAYITFYHTIATANSLPVLNGGRPEQMAQRNWPLSVITYSFDGRDSRTTRDCHRWIDCMLQEKSQTPTSL